MIRSTFLKRPFIDSGGAATDQDAVTFTTVQADSMKK